MIGSGLGTFYFDTRAKHKIGNKSWVSAFAVGDILRVTYKNGTSRDYTNTDYYYDADDWGDDFFNGADRLYYPEIENPELKPGDNIVKIWYKGLSTNIKVYLETPEMRAKAKAEAMAKAKAEAMAKAANIDKATVSAADIKKASNLGLTSITLGAKVKKIKKNAFKGTKINTVTVKSKKLKAKSVKGSLKGSKVKTIRVKVGNKKTNKKFVKKYKKIFTKKNAGKKVKVK